MPHTPNQIFLGVPTPGGVGGGDWQVLILSAECLEQLLLFIFCWQAHFIFFLFFYFLFKNSLYNPDAG